MSHFGTASRVSAQGPVTPNLAMTAGPDVFDTESPAMTRLRAIARSCARSALLATCVALCAGTQAQGTDAPTPPPAGDAAPTTSQPPNLSLKINAVNPEDLLDSQKTVVVPTAYVSLVTEGRVSAVKQSGFFQSGNNSARASAAYKVAGLDKAFAQQLAQAAYDDFVAQLRGAGYTVLTYADVKDRDVLRAAQRDTQAGPMGLPVASEGGNQLVVAAPSDEQHFKSGWAGGEFAEFQAGGKSKFTDATLIIPHYVFHAPQAWAEGNRGYKSVSAQANVAEGMNMFSARAHWMGQPKSRMMRGIPGVATREQVINVTEKAGSVALSADTTPTGSNVANFVGGLFGMGNTQKSSGEYLLTIDRNAYTQGVMAGVRSFNAEVAKVAAGATR